MTALPALSREAKVFIRRLDLTDQEGDAFDKLADLRCAIKTGEWAQARAALDVIGRQIEIMEANHVGD